MQISQEHTKKSFCLVSYFNAVSSYSVNKKGREGKGREDKRREENKERKERREEGKNGMKGKFSLRENT